MAAVELSGVLARLRSELDHVMKFWIDHSHDTINGGFFTCLSQYGEVYDTLKYGWLQGRQVWMYSKLYNNTTQYHTAAILEAARAGGEFLLKSVLSPDGSRCYFVTTSDGRPCGMQRKPYTECFYVMALAELSRATGDGKYWRAAEDMLSRLIHWIRVDDSELGVPKFAGNSPTSELGRPMMLLNVLTEFCNGDSQLREKYIEHFQWAVEAILKHADGHWVREFVSPDGAQLPGCKGRQVTPGHALEAGWFLLQEAAARSPVDTVLIGKAIDWFIRSPYEYGSDQEHGGLYYFLDTDGHSPTQLEWSMKLWWVHCEAMLAFLTAYQATRDQKHLSTFLEITQYTLDKFSDPVAGEWYGYLTREGKLNQSFKAGPYKGCFHVPRTLLYCIQILEKLDLN